MEVEKFRFKEGPKERILEEKEKLPKGVKEIETPEAKFRIIYDEGHGSSEKKPEILGEFDALFLEVLYPTVDYSQPVLAEKKLQELAQLKTQKAFIERARKEKNRSFLVTLSKRMRLFFFKWV